MFVYEAMHGRPLPVYRDGKQTRTFTYITDAIVGFFKALLEGRSGEAYNIGLDEGEISMHDLACAVLSFIPHSAIQYMPYTDAYPENEPLRRCPDLTKARHDLGYDPKISIRDGLFKFITWAQSNPDYIK